MEIKPSKQCERMICFCLILFSFVTKLFFFNNFFGFYGLKVQPLQVH